VASPRFPGHLNTPRLVADATGTTVWKWDQQEPFGDSPADDNPSGAGTFDLALRLPGQYYDKESGLHYNYFRDYDPNLGRYGESDPIGVRVGLNTYAYGLGSPQRFADPYGLAVELTAGLFWPNRPTVQQVQQALKQAIKNGRICLGKNDDCSKIHLKVYKLCTDLFANVAAVLCKINADQIAESCIVNPDLYRCPKGSAACPVPSTSLMAMDDN